MGRIEVHSKSPNRRDYRSQERAQLKELYLGSCSSNATGDLRKDAVVPVSSIFV